jgi:hexosaminidase
MLLVLMPFLSSLLAPAQTKPELDLMPWPASVQTSTGELRLDQSFTVGVRGNDDPRVKRAALRLLDRLSRQTGVPMRPGLADAAHATLVVTAEHGSERVQAVGEDESYALEVTPAGATITAPNALGVMHGMETFLQLVRAGASGFSAPAVVIHDAPRFPWRGLLIDSARHFIPPEVIRRNLDGMAAVKLNVFHWHLSDYQAFRIESRKSPKLQEMGSGGLYYTQDQVRDIIAYARDRGIRVVPEFDMPGHSTSWFVGYPELASGGGPYHLQTNFGVFDDAMDPTRESTYRFLDKFLEEMTRLFPDPYFHIGGDEVTGKDWDRNPAIQEFMKARGIKTDAELQAYFTTRVQKILKKYRKTMVGWDEVMQGDIPPEVVIQSWRGPRGLAAAARAGHRVVLSNGFYIDLMQPASQHYLIEPLSGDAATLTPEQQKLVLGGEATMWSELVTPENIDSRIWPRTAAIAERLWSPQSVTDVDSMYRRLAAISEDLDWAGLTHNSYYRPALERIAGPRYAPPLAALASALEPPKEYARLDIDQVSTATAYNRLVDVLHPESDAAREFAQAVERIVAKKAAPDDEGRARALLAGWSGQEQALALAFRNSPSFLLKELAPVSQQVAALARTGLEALDYVDKGAAPPPSWTQQALALADAADKPQASTMVMIAAPVRLLVQAAGGAHAATP